MATFQLGLGRYPFNLCEITASPNASSTTGPHALKCARTIPVSVFDVVPIQRGSVRPCRNRDVVPACRSRPAFRALHRWYDCGQCGGDFAHATRSRRPQSELSVLLRLEI